MARTTNENGKVLSSTSSTVASTQQDAIPILKSLPLVDPKAKADTNTGDVLWALISLTSLLSDKTSRTQLLMPGHQLVARVMIQLHVGNDLQVRDAASGFLRNLCIEAGSKARKTMEERRNVDVILSEIIATADQLSLGQLLKEKSEINGSLLVPDEAEEKRKYLKELQSKPKEQLNKKEKRHLAKLESAAKSVSETAADVAMDNQDGTADVNASIRGIEDDEKVLLSISHLTNLFAILWSLVEMSPQATDQCKKSATPICSIIASIVRRTTQNVDTISYYSLENALESKDGNSICHVDFGLKNELAKDQALIHLASTSLNALVTLTDSDPEFAAAFIGCSRQELRAASKKSGKTFLYDEADEVNSSPSVRTHNVESLLTTFHAFDRQVDAVSRDRLRPATSLALLSAAVFHNIVSCLPRALTDAVRLVKSTTETLYTSEMTVVLHFLNQVLAVALTSYKDILFTGLETQADKLKSNHILSPEDKTADEVFNHTSLCLEIMAELVSDPEGWSDQSAKGKRSEEDSIEFDEDGDAEMDQDESMSDEGETEEIVLEEDSITEVDNLVSSFTESRVAQYFSAHQVNFLLALSVEQRGAFHGLRRETSTSDDKVASSLRSIAIRALSVLNNQMLALASYAHPPPSQPSHRAEGLSKSFRQWLTSTVVQMILGKIWRRQFEYASQIASLPYINDISAANSLGQDARKVLELSLCIMWSLSRCFECVEGTQSSKVLLVEAAQFNSDESCQVSHQSHGVIDSLIAAYKSSKRGTGASMLPPSDLNASPVAVQLSPTPDGIRIHSSGILSTLLRQSHVDINSKEQIVLLLLDTLEVLPTRSDVMTQLTRLGLQDSTSMDAMVVAINGIIDTFADENSKWDQLYAKLRMQGRLKRASIDVKSSVSLPSLLLYYACVC